MRKHKNTPQIQDDQPYNTFTELQIFQSHTDIVRLLIHIKESRFASASDDCRVIIWDLETGQRIHILNGHSRPVSCLSVYDVSCKLGEIVLLTGASDKLICLWGVETGDLLRTITTHQGPVRCLETISTTGFFCAAGEALSVWNCRGKLVSQFKTKSRISEEDIQYIVVLSDDLIVTAADKDLTVYKFIRDIEKSSSNHSIQLMAKLQRHPDAIQSLCYLNDTCFASGSIDGSIVLWSYRQNAWQQLWEYTESAAKEDKMFHTSIQSILPLGNKLLIVAVGNGYTIFDFETGKIVKDQKNAHKLKIQDMLFIKERAWLITCSEDSSIRLWGNPHQHDQELYLTWDQAIHSFLQIHQQDCSMQLYLIGECLGHTGPVNGLLQFDDKGFVSCGTDMLVLAWKNGKLAETKRRELVSKILTESQNI